jgi:hypothetical protein
MCLTRPTLGDGVCSLLLRLQLGGHLRQNLHAHPFANTWDGHKEGKSMTILAYNSAKHKIFANQSQVESKARVQPALP